MKKSVSSLLLLSAAGAALSPSLCAASAGDNIALGKPVFASTVESSELAPEYAVDGDSATRWSSNFSDNNWITVDLEERHELFGVTLHWQNSYSTDYDVKVSDDGENWTTLESVSGSDGGVDQLDLSGVARYVRIEGYDRATAWGHSLWELQVHGQVYSPEPSAPESENLALNKTVFASSVQRNELAPEQAVDGDLSTRWSSDFNDNNWLTVDLGDRYTLSSVNIHWENAYSKDYDIKVSNDGNEWTTLASVVDSDGALDELAISGNARYLRVEGYDRATAWGHSIWELEVFGHDVVETPDPVEVTKVSEGKPAVASSAESSSLTADHVVDGDEGTRWSSQFRDDSWVYVDLGDVHEIVQVALLWEVSHASDYDIQTSYDAVNWTTIEQVVGSDGGLDELTLSGHGRYVRMKGLRRATKWGYSLWEMEVFGYVSESQGSDGSTDSGTDGGDPDSGGEGGDSGDAGTGSGTDETLDEQAPSVPSGLAVTALDDTSVALTWQRASDDTAVISYQVYRNGSFLTEALAPATEVTDSALVVGVDYTYTVRAGDEAGNWSATSAPVSVTLESEEVMVSGDIRFEWTTPDQRENGDYLELYEIGGYELRYHRVGADAAQSVMVDDPNTTEYRLDLPDGSYEFSIAVYDTNGRYSEFVPIQPLP